MKKRIVFLTHEGVYLPFAIRCQEEGSDVRVFWTKKTETKSGTGFVEELESLAAIVRWKPDAVIVDATGTGALADNLRKAGLPVYGGSHNADVLEFDRDGVLALMEDVGIAIPESHSFKTIPEAQGFLKGVKEWGGWAIKLDGEKYAGSSLTFVASSVLEAREVLESYRTVVKTRVDITLQKKIIGTEVSNEGFWNGAGWEDSFWNHTFERKKFMEGDLGPNVGCAGDVVFAAERDRLMRESVVKLETAFRKFRFYGQVDVNTIVAGEDKKVYALELTPRFGVNATLTFMSMWETEVSDWLVRVAQGRAGSIKLRDRFGASVTVSIPPFPATKTAGVSRGVPVLIRKDLVVPIDSNQADRKRAEKPFSRFNFFDVEKVGDHILSAGRDGWIASPVGQGKRITEAVHDVYENVRELTIPNMQYRRDIGKDAEWTYEQLRYDDFF